MLATTIRRARPEDGPRIIELDRELARFERLTPPDAEEAQRLLGWVFESGRMEALVAEVDGRIEGIALFYERLQSFRARPFLHLEDLLVTEAAKRTPRGRSAHGGARAGGALPANRTRRVGRARLERGRPAFLPAPGFAAHHGMAPVLARREKLEELARSEPG